MGILKLVENVLKVAASSISTAMSIVRLIDNANKWKKANA